MTRTSEPYLVIRTLERKLLIHELVCSRRVCFGAYQVRVDDRWVAMEADEPHYSTGGKPIRGLKLYASGAAATALVELEATLQGGRGSVQLADADQVVFDVAGTPVGSTLYLGGDFVGDRAPEWFPFRITLPDTTTIHGFALDQKWRGGRVLALDDVSAADELTLIQAVVVWIKARRWHGISLRFPPRYAYYRSGLYDNDRPVCPGTG